MTVWKPNRTWRDLWDLTRLRTTYRPVGRYMELREAECEFCGRKELAIPTMLEVPLCREHFDNTHNKELIKAQGRVKVATNIWGTYKCAVCGKQEPVMYLVTFRHLCYYCLWQVFGGQGKRAMKVDGVRVI